MGARVDRGRLLLFGYAAVFLATLLWSAIEPYDYLTWFLEVLPAVLGLVVLAWTYRRFRFTPLVYFLVFAHALVLVVGGHYTYALVPHFTFDLPYLGGVRNHYDKLGHLMQGIAPAMVTRELLLRLGIVTRPRWAAFLTLCVVLAISAFYELIEWWVALAAGIGAEAFLGTQGFAWDTQSDMALALLGGALALALLSGWHDRQMRAVQHFRHPRPVLTSQNTP